MGGGPVRSPVESLARVQVGGREPEPEPEAEPEPKAEPEPEPEPEAPTSGLAGLSLDELLDTSGALPLSRLLPMLIHLADALDSCELGAEWTADDAKTWWQTHLPSERVGAPAY